MYSMEIKEEALHLRLHGRLSLKAIAERLGISKGTASKWLRDYPLDDYELSERMHHVGGDRRSHLNIIKDKDPSFLYTIRSKEHFTRHIVAKVSEAAVTLRLLLCGCSIYSSVYDGDKFDCVAARPDGILVKIQVKTAKCGAAGNPAVSVKCADGRGKHRVYQQEELDLLVGYSLYLDRAYVYTFAEIAAYTSTISVNAGAEERWDKLYLVGQN